MRTIYRPQVRTERRGVRVDVSGAVDLMLRSVAEASVLRAAEPEDKPATPNEAHAAGAFLEMAQLQSVVNWVQAQVDDGLSKLRAVLLAELSRDEPEKFLKTADRLVRSAYEALAEEVKGYMARVSAAVARRASKRLAEHHGLKSRAPDREAATGGALVLGAPLTEHFAKMADDLLFRVRAAVRTGVAARDDKAGLVRRVFGEDARLVKAAGIFGDSDKVSVVAVFRDNDGRTEVLLGKRRDDEDDPAAGLWALPGGHVAEAEDSETAARREVLEEVGINVDRLRKLTDLPGGVNVYGTLYTGDEPIKTSDEIGAVQWADVGDLPEGLAFGNNDLIPRLLDMFNSLPVGAASAGEVRGALQVAVDLMDGAANSLNKVIEAAMAAYSNEAVGTVAEALAEAESMGWQWLAVMDDRVCERCEFYDGSRWDSDYEPVGDAPEFPDDPPLHFGCRCSLVPSDLEDEPSVKDFDSYLAGFSRSEQEAAFGKATLAAYRRGEVTAAQMIGQKENLMTLKAFEEAG